MALRALATGRAFPTGYWSPLEMHESYDFLFKEIDVETRPPFGQVSAWYMIDEMSELLTQCTTVLHIAWLDWLRSLRLSTRRTPSRCSCELLHCAVRDTIERRVRTQHVVPKVNS